MNTLIIVLRLLHIVGGVIWVGGAVAMAFFVAPSVGATAEAGQKFMGHLMTKTRFSTFMTIAALAAVLPGFALYWIDSAGFTLRAWMESGTGTTFAVGAVFALIGLYYGMKVPGIGRAMGQLAAEIKGAPTPEQMTHLSALRQKQMRVSIINVTTLLIATLCMSIARYLHF